MFLENRPYPQDLRVRREANALRAAGYQVAVICPIDTGQPFRETVDGVSVYRYPAPPDANGLFAYLWEYGYSMFFSFLLSVRVFFAEGFDVVHAHNPPDTFVFIAVFYKLFGKRFVYDHHDLSPEMYQARFAGGGNPLVYRILVWLEKLSCYFADHVIVTNESYKKIARERGCVPESHITIVRNGMELNRLEAAIEPDPGLREMGKAIIGYVGVMGFQDGVDYLLRAVHHLIHDLGRTDFHCILIGGGDAWESLKTQARQLGLDDCVQFTGYVFGEQLRRYLSAADICVDSAPSSSYGDRSTVFKMMEYMALGKPIVAFDLPEHRFTAQDAAVYVRPNDERAFAAALAQLMDDPRRRSCLGAYGIQRIKTQLAWEYSVPKLLEVYQTILAHAHVRLPASPNAEISIHTPRAPLPGAAPYRSSD